MSGSESSRTQGILVGIVAAVTILFPLVSVPDMKVNRG